MVVYAKTEYDSTASLRKSNSSTEFVKCPKNFNFFISASR